MQIRLREILREDMGGTYGVWMWSDFKQYPKGQYNVNVNVVCPSQTMSDMLSESMSNNEIAALAENIPLRRIATINEQVGPILFLCSDLSAYMTGAVIDVNGGQI